MYKIKFTILAALVFFISCSKNDLSEQDKTTLRNILNENQKIHEILFKDDQKIPSLYALKKTLGVSDNTVFADYLKQMGGALDKTTSTSRKDFIIGYSAFSEILARMLKQYKMTDEYHHFYCNMVEKSWISKGLKIENPYDPEMRDCGEIISK